METAARHGLTIKGDPPAQALPYTAQVNETDLAFLQRMADMAGAVFTVKGDNLIFHDVKAIAKQPTIYVIKRTDIASASFSDKLKETAVSYTHFDGDRQENIETLEDGETDSPDKLRSRAPVKDQGQQKAAAAVRSKASKASERTASIELEGNTLLVAGGLVELQGFGVLDGLWAIETATHSIDAGSGYKTSLELKLP
jgi:phage protein D